MRERERAWMGCMDGHSTRAICQMQLSVNAFRAALAQVRHRLLGGPNPIMVLKHFAEGAVVGAVAGQRI